MINVAYTKIYVIVTFRLDKNKIIIHHISILLHFLFLEFVSLFIHIKYELFRRVLSVTKVLAKNGNDVSGIVPTNNESVSPGSCLRRKNKSTQCDLELLSLTKYSPT